MSDDNRRDPSTNEPRPTLPASNPEQSVYDALDFFIAFADIEDFEGDRMVIKL